MKRSIFSSPKLNLDWKGPEIMHFEITKCKIFLGKGLPPYNIQKSYTYIHLDQRAGLKFDIFSSPIIECYYSRGRCPLATLKSNTLTNLKYLRTWNYAFYLTKYKFSYTRGCCLGPLSRALPLDPTRGSIGGPGPHSWVLALWAQCFSLQAIPESWKPCISSYIDDNVGKKLLSFPI